MTTCSHREYRSTTFPVFFMWRSRRKWCYFNMNMNIIWILKVISYNVFCSAVWSKFKAKDNWEDWQYILCYDIGPSGNIQFWKQMLYYQLSCLLETEDKNDNICNTLNSPPRFCESPSDKSSWHWWLRGGRRKYLRLLQYSVQNSPSCPILSHIIWSHYEAYSR